MAITYLLICKQLKITSGLGNEKHISLSPDKIIFTDFYRFKSNYFESGLGFKIKYHSTNELERTFRIGSCGGQFSTPGGILTSPSYPDNYPNDADCVYSITRPNGTCVNLKVMAVDVEERGPFSGCYDYLEIRDGPSQESPLLKKLCGNQIPSPIKSTQNNLWMR